MSTLQQDHEHQHPVHRAPAQCPVCEGELQVTRLGCPECGSEVGGRFARCGFCSLDRQQLELLTTFLATRGNLRELARQQQVSYPTVRARFSSLLASLGIEERGTEGEPGAAEAEPVRTSGVDQDELLAAVAQGRLDPAEAARMIQQGWSA